MPSTSRLRLLPATALSAVLVLTLAACGATSSGGSGPFGGQRGTDTGRSSTPAEVNDERLVPIGSEDRRKPKGTIWDLFSGSANENITVEVNKYLWQSSLEVLNFLPIETVDPFTGVIVTGYGRPPGGGRAYRATIYVQDPSLEARSLKVSLQVEGGGSVSPDTVRAVEDAILTRARQLRVRDSRL